MEHGLIWRKELRVDQGKLATKRYGIADYAEVIREMTKGLENVDMIIDPRLGSASYQKSEGTSNIITDPLMKRFM